MVFETERLILRPWRESDAEYLYKYASSPLVGPLAGWQAHKDVEQSKEVIKTVLSAPETYAVVLKSVGHAVGSICIMTGDNSNISIPKSEGEIGYWIGVPFWGQGLIPEAVCEMLRRAFEDLRLKKVWCGYFDGNEKSRRVQEKCGFTYKYTLPDVPWPMLNDVKTLHLSYITKKEWKSRTK
ncbi:MAG: GNAT family N-acetyltransferase [Clostridia bacterium]|nr:GNAT family N-acetyltransferase [Clostridia bacterium]